MACTEFGKLGKMSGGGTCRHCSRVRDSGNVEVNCNAGGVVHLPISS